MTVVKRQVLIKNVQHNAATATTNHTDFKTQGQFGCGGVVNVTCKHPFQASSSGCAHLPDS